MLYLEICVLEQSVDAAMFAGSTDGMRFANVILLAEQILVQSL